MAASTTTSTNMFMSLEEQDEKMGINAADMDDSILDRQLESVQLDALAFVKIAQACSGGASIQVTGQIVGIEDEGVLKVANCFTMPVDMQDCKN